MLKYHTRNRDTSSLLMAALMQNAMHAQCQMFSVVNSCKKAKLRTQSFSAPLNAITKSSVDNVSHKTCTINNCH